MRSYSLQLLPSAEEMGELELPWHPAKRVGHGEMLPCGGIDVSIGMGAGKVSRQDDLESGGRWLAWGRFKPPQD